MEAFIYKWTDKGAGKFYIGAHKGVPDDGYICSSKVMMREYRKRPLDFSREILSFHETFYKALKQESFLLEQVDAANNPLYYNLRNNNSNTDWGKKPAWNKGKKHSLKTIEKIRLTRLGKDLSNLTGKPKSEAHKLAMRGERPHVNQRGEKNNNAKAIITPFGEFGSLRDCSRALNMKYDAVMWKLNSSNYPDWRRL